jgi:hypothetical protein
MKSIKLAWVLTLTLLTALSVPLRLAAQDKDNHNDEQRHHHYRLIDIGTLGGPVSYLSAAGQGSLVLNSQGMVAGFADTSSADPFFPNCFDPDCFVAHGFLWRHGVLSDLGALSANANRLGAFTFFVVIADSPVVGFVCISRIVE